MSPNPTGRLRTTATGRDLVLIRTFRAPIDDVWDSVTQPERVGRWFGTWSAEVVVGVPFEFTMTAEEGNPVCAMTVTTCTPPRHLAASTVDDYGTWNLEVNLTEANGVTTLEFIHHLPPDAPLGDVGPGWEYYLDRLVASREGGAMPDFDDYYPSMQDYFNAQGGAEEHAPPA
jgi:uncharacterized protein YndB with AHSA1/START domain